jgi:hypothetical protein
MFISRGSYYKRVIAVVITCPITVIFYTIGVTFNSLESLGYLLAIGLGIVIRSFQEEYISWHS